MKFQNVILNCNMSVKSNNEKFGVRFEIAFYIIYFISSVKLALSFMSLSRQPSGPASRSKGHEGEILS